jgi:acylglycerol lipase
MLNGGMALDTQAAWDAWPQDLPLLVWHGDADPICDPAAAKRFGENAAAKDKQVEMVPVSSSEALLF